MATSESFKDFVLENLERANAEFSLNFTFSARKMFGEYCIYVNDKGVLKPLCLLCDESVFVKKLAELAEFVAQNAERFETGYPYDGAKEHFIIDTENAEFLGALLEILVPLLPTPKPKKPKNK